MNYMANDMCMVHLLGDIFNGGGVMMLDKETVKEIRCFICGKRVHPDEIVVMSFTPDDMVCVCKRHLKHRYPHGTFDNISRRAEEKL